LERERYGSGLSFDGGQVMSAWMNRPIRYGRILIRSVSIAAFVAAAVSARADPNYSQQVFFENSLSPLTYFYSSGRASAPSTLSLIDGKVPIETSVFISGPNALELQWKSIADGGWAAELHLYEWRDRKLEFPGANLWIWLRSDEGIRAADLPKLPLRDVGRNFSHPLDIGEFTDDLPPGKWVRVRIPLTAFKDASVHGFEPHHLNTLVFSQGAADATPHKLFVDDIRIEDDPPAGQAAPPTPQGIQAKGYERHVDITWNPVDEPSLAQYVIYRSIDGAPFQPIGVQRAGVNRYCDYNGNEHMTASYRVTARTSSLRESDPSSETAAATRPMTDDELLTMVQEASFRYYWEAAEPHSGMTRESTPGDDDIVAVGASGFGVMAIVVGAQRGFITRQEAIERLLRITGFLATADRYHGAWPHFLSGSTGRTLPVFSMYDDGADLVETSFLMEGLLTARQYFKADGPAGRELYDRITKLWDGVDWNWFRATPKRDALYWHWSPDYSFYIANRLTGWNEVMITYLEAIASPTHAIRVIITAGGLAKALENNTPMAEPTTESRFRLAWEREDRSSSPTSRSWALTRMAVMTVSRITSAIIVPRPSSISSTAFITCTTGKAMEQIPGASPLSMAPRDTFLTSRRRQAVGMRGRDCSTTERSLPRARSVLLRTLHNSRWPRSNIFIVISALRCGESMDFAMPSICRRTGIPA
jgi:exo beta-1,2-glucooligosaccharide sophorohydrolase (non-reducing end)